MAEFNQKLLYAEDLFNNQNSAQQEKTLMQDLIDASTLLLTTFKQDIPKFDGIVDTQPCIASSLKSLITSNREEKYASLINLYFLIKK